MPLDLTSHIEKVSNEPCGLPGTRDELSVTGAFLATCEALKNREPFSIVRMSDGETQILDYCDEHRPDAEMLQFHKEWNERYGVVGISCGEIKRRLWKAAEECTYLAQDGWIPYCINGVRRFIHRQPFIWPRFPDAWTAKQKRELYSLADDHVLVVNRDLNRAALVAGNDAHLSFVGLDNWRQADDVIDAASRIDSPLALVSAGPGSKHIVPELAKQGKVALDIGSAAERWWKSPEAKGKGE